MNTTRLGRTASDAGKASKLGPGKQVPTCLHPEEAPTPVRISAPRIKMIVLTQLQIESHHLSPAVSVSLKLSMKWWHIYKQRHQIDFFYRLTNADTFIMRS